MATTEAEAIYYLGVINGMILSAKLSDDVENMALDVLDRIIAYVSKGDYVSKKRVDK